MEEAYYDPETGSHVEFEPRRVLLDGSGRYEIGEIQAYEGWFE